MPPLRPPDPKGRAMTLKGRPCGIEGCERPANVNGGARGMCGRCYQRADRDKRKARQTEAEREAAEFNPVPARVCRCLKSVRAEDEETGVAYCFTCGCRLPESDPGDAPSADHTQKLRKVAAETARRVVALEDENRDAADALSKLVTEVRDLHESFNRATSKPGVELLGAAVASATEGRPAGRDPSLRDFTPAVESADELVKADSRSRPTPPLLTVLREREATIAEQAAEIESLRAAADKPEPDKPAPYLNVEEAAAYLACRKRRVYELVEQCRLVPFRDGRRLLFTRADLDAALERGKP